jgi:protein-disulfide isomerase
MADNKKPQPKSNAPMLIIGLVLVVGAVAGWYWMTKPKNPAAANSANKTNANNTNSTSGIPKPPTIPANAPPGASPGPNVAGSPSALITLEEFADYQCGSCAAAHPVMNEIKSYYGSKIKFVFRNFPLAIPSHDKAYDAAVAVEAAGMQGKYWDFQNQIFANQKAWSSAPNYKQMFKEYAQKVGLDVAKWENDMIGMGAKERVDADLARGRAIGVNATPTLYINGTPFQFGDMQPSTLKNAIDAEFKKLSEAGSTGNTAPSNAEAPKQ